jgi:ATP-dependent Clp protease ATP-binding subunit ClpX
MRGMKSPDLFDEDDEPFNLFDEPLYDVPEPPSVREFVEALPLLSPPAIFAELGDLGYKGQDAQRRALSLMAYRHVRRLKRLHVEEVPRRSLPPKQNVLMIGPTGCGKTFLVELLFQNIFKLPTAIIDITSFTESGYVGDSVNTIITRLANAADNRPEIAACGVICLDEFDKLASAVSSARFAGQGTTKDVAGYGVQRELLAMIEGTEVMAPMDYGFSEFGYRSPVSTRDIPFIACGAFSGFEEMLKRQRQNIGFHDGNGDDPDPLTIDEAASFQKYGFLPELIGRFARVVQFPALPRETLHKILAENVLPQFHHEFAGERLRLTVTDAATELILSRCEKRGAGARGLHTEIVAAVEKAAFENFMQNQDAEVVSDAQNGRLTDEVRSER